MAAGGQLTNTHDTQPFMAQDCRMQVSKACATLEFVFTGGYSILVSLQMMLPPIEPPVSACCHTQKEVRVTQFLLQSGPLCRILQQ